MKNIKSRSTLPQLDLALYNTHFRHWVSEVYVPRRLLCNFQWIIHNFIKLSNLY